MAGDEYCRHVTEDTDPSPQDEAFQFEAQDHGGTILAGLCHLRDQEKLFDVVLTAECQSFPAHRVVLASCSDYFRCV